MDKKYYKMNIEVSSSDSINDIKYKIFKQINVPIQKQQIIFMNVKRNDNEYVSEQMKDNDVFLVLR